MSVKKSQKTKKSKVFLYQLEFAGNEQVLLVHTRSKFPDVSGVDCIDFYSTGKEFAEDIKKRHPLFKTLARIHGIESASGGGYTLQVQKANNLFTWEELIPKILRAIQKHVAGEVKMEERGPAIHSQEF